MICTCSPAEAPHNIRWFKGNFLILILFFFNFLFEWTRIIYQMLIKCNILKIIFYEKAKRHEITIKMGIFWLFLRSCEYTNVLCIELDYFIMKYDWMRLNKYLNQHQQKYKVCKLSLIRIHFHPKMKKRTHYFLDMYIIILEKKLVNSRI